MVTVGDGAVVLGGKTAILSEAYVEGHIRRVPVVIGEYAVVGSGSVLLPGSVVPPHTTLSPRTRFDGTEVNLQPGSTWTGSPAVLISDAKPEELLKTMKALGGRAQERWPWLLLDSLGQLIVPLLSLALPLPM
jgi:acetyltransferase-like isoleucine patch superfamily enzyme